MNPQKTYVLDTSAVLSIQQLFSNIDIDPGTTIQLVTTHEIINEFKNDFSKYRIKAMISSSELKSMQPSIDALNKISIESKKIGNQSRLSSQDKSVLALALEKVNEGESIIILTDDYEIQNTASFLGIKFQSIRTKGIKYRVKFKKICNDCKNTNIDPDETECHNCGSSNIRNRKIKEKI